MLSLLTCSVSPLDDLDSFDVAPPLRQRRVSRSLGFIKSTSPGPKRRRVAKMTIGHPTNFRHEFHLGKEMVPDDMISVWDSERWQQALEKEDSSSSPPSSIAPSTVPSSPTMKCDAAKRRSFTPQKRKPVPSLIPDIDSLPIVVPHDIPLPPSPVGFVSESENSECGPSGLFFLIPDPPRRSMDDNGEREQPETADDYTVCETTPATQVTMTTEESAV